MQSPCDAAIICAVDAVHIVKFVACYDDAHEMFRVPLLQIIAGLRKHIEQPQLEGSLVVVILNLKAAKLAGELSEG